MNPSIPSRPSIPHSRRPAGSVGAPVVDQRQTLLDLAGVSSERQAEAVAKAFEKKVALLEAVRTQYFAREGEVMEERTHPAIDIQLKAAEALDRMLGVNAPPATRSITIVHTLDIPEWYRTPTQEPATITIETHGGAE
jgi:hypothetical protein